MFIALGQRYFLVFLKFQVSQGPLLFNIFFCELFIVIPNYDVAKYADNITPYSTGKYLQNVFLDLEKTSEKLLIRKIIY